MEPYCATPTTYLDGLLDQHPEMRRVWERHKPPQHKGERILVTWHHSGPWTTCVLLFCPDFRPEDFNTPYKTAVGTSKRCRYGPRADKHDPLIGETIALSRALQNAAQVLP